MAPRRLVAVRHCQALAVKGMDVLAEYCARPNPTACLLLLADESLAAARDRKDHWLLGAVPAGAIVGLLARQGAALEQWLRRRATGEGITVSEEAARLLVQWVGDDSAALLGEVRKAALAGGPENRTVGVKEVSAVVGEHRVSGVFDLTRAVERRDVGLALRTLESLLATEEPMLLLAMLSREVRTAWTIREWLKRGQSIEQIARTLRRPLPAVQAHASARESPATEASRLRRCWAAETRLKSGGDPRGELSALVVALCGR
jgi:DNA polymerase-3 subunit delta